MAKAAVIESSPNYTFLLGRVRADAMTKRKTPSELRGEQLKRRSCELSADSQSVSLRTSDKLASVVRRLKKPESSKTPRYIDTRVDEVYPVKKSSDRWRMLYGKEKPKAVLPSSGKTDEHNNPFADCKFGDKNKTQLSGDKATTSNITESVAPIVDIAEQHSLAPEKCCQKKLLTVTELSVGSKRFSGAANVDMDKALKGLVAGEILDKSGLPADSSRKCNDLSSLSSRKFCSEIHLLGHKSPLDFTLKTTLRLVSSSSVKWCHKLSASSSYNYTNQFSNTAEVLYSKALHTWAYPQSSLPPSIVSAMTLSASTAETEFLEKRQQDWVDSFRSLYYMLRKNVCHIFYVYTAQFVAMFIGGNFLGKKKRSCNAYLSRSTHGLRSLLREHDVHFSMPLCHSEVEQATADDLVEFSEIERRNLGQTLHSDSLSDLDGSPQSLLAFMGNEKAHGLYDFLLNYRHFLSSLTGIDVPILYSPVPFHNASISFPEVRCKEMKRADVLPTSSGSNPDDTEPIPNSPGSSVCYSIEVKDAVLPPWIISRVCLAMGSEGRSFESSFTTEPISVGLNVALESVCCKSDPHTESDKCMPTSGDAFGISEAAITPSLQSAYLNGLKYSNGSYVASVAPL